MQTTSSLPPPPPPPPGTDASIAHWGLGDVLLVIPVLFVVTLPATALAALAGVDDTGLVGIGIVAQTAVFLAWPQLVVRWKGRGARRDLGFRFEWPLDLGVGLAAGIGALFAGGVAGAVLRAVLDPGGETSNTGIVEDAEGSAWLAVIALCAALLVPVAEELLFRGLLLRAVAKRWNLTAGAVTSGVVFVLVHVQFNGLAEDLVLLGSIGAYTVVLTLLVTRNRRLGPAIVAHATVNSIGVLVTLAA